MTPPDGAPAAAPSDVTVAPVLTAALQAAASGSQLEATLHDIVQAAVQHVDAAYGAMGVLSPDGRRLDRFVIAGTGADDRGGKRQPPDEHRILSLLGTEGTQLDDLAERSFLGVPVCVGESVFGHLYLTEKTTGGPFTPSDAEVAEALAAVAGMAIENARMAERAETRGRWGQAATEMATALLSGADADHVLQAVSTQVSELCKADMAGVLAPSVDDDSTMTIVAAVGPAAGDVEGVRFPSGPGSYLAQLQEARAPRLIDDASAAPLLGLRSPAAMEVTAGFGPAMTAPLGKGPGRGLLAVMRAKGREQFTGDDLELLAGFAAQASVVLELARAQERERRLQVQADRDRIARDLHDHVVQRIFATGLALDRISRSLAEKEPEAAARIGERVDELDGTIARIRTAIFALQEADDDASPVAVRRRLGEVVRSVTEGHGLRPDLRVRNEVEDLPPDLVHEMVAVVRELVTNVVRHAAASRLTVEVTVGDAVSVVVTDDGCGLPSITVRSGLANLDDRAERRGGRMTCSSGESGTRVSWTVPRPAAG